MYQILRIFTCIIRNFIHCDLPCCNWYFHLKLSLFLKFVTKLYWQEQIDWLTDTQICHLNSVRLFSSEPTLETKSFKFVQHLTLYQTWLKQMISHCWNTLTYDRFSFVPLNIFDNCMYDTHYSFHFLILILCHKLY